MNDGNSFQSMYGAILLPDFELQCTLRTDPVPENIPVALIGETAGTVGTHVVQMNAVAQAAGVVHNMSLPQAQARCPQLVLRRRDEAQEAVATVALVQAAERASPYLENTFPGCCTLDLRLHAETNHEPWAYDLVATLLRFHLRAQVGVASTPDAALQAAQLARPVLVSSDALQARAQLPVMVLGPSESVLDILYDWGIHRVGELRALGRQQVAERLGVEGLALWDRAGGGSPRPLRYVKAAEIYEEVVEFDGGIETLEPMLFRLRRSLEQLSQRLRADFLLAGSVELTLELDDRRTLARTINIPAPTCEVEVLFRVLSTYLDTVQTDTRISGFRLRAFPSTPRDHQIDLWHGSLRDPNKFSETLAKLSGIVGTDRVGTPRRLPTHRPNSFRMEAPDFDRDKPRDAPAGSSAKHCPHFLPIGLSLRRYRPPWRVRVENKRQRPVWLQGRDLEGQILESAGPWMMDGCWWDDDAVWAWSEWDIQMARGGLYRLAHHRQADWWMLGLYD